ncbi:hypothetical protein QRD43_11775 [Pelomonas sp. APW6]|uniref:DUF3592 domain-containing protein n=1 Tax=Roseateles subflavus TaxID=3053353 RepID=A0ABT7LIA3_9BURK|nr:hypothetical protein [Pelomonas sp. APW6]MDL5032582.1 hypothetical protein [Pelomonas sp. APW6]
MPATLVATVLAGLTAAAAALLLVVLCWQARARAGSWHAGMLDLVRRTRRPLRGLMTVALLLAGAELLLPAERIDTQVYFLQRLESGRVELTYELCCSGGGMDACVLPEDTGLKPGQAVTLHRTRLLGRCRAHAREEPPAPCRCA